MKRLFVLTLALAAALGVTARADVIGPVEYAARSGLLPAVLVLVIVFITALILCRRKR